MKFIISDLHFFHKNIINFDGRPFNTVEEMNRVLIDNWNSVITNKDTVYVLGDMFFKAKSNEVVDVLEELNGKIIYIWGNHEKVLRTHSSITNSYFNKTEEILTIPYTHREKDYRLSLGHYPIPMFDGHFRDTAIHFYGHVHVTNEQMFSVYQQLMNFSNRNEPYIHLMLNVGAMMKLMNYTPIPVAYAIELAEEQSRKLFSYFNDECKGVMPTIEEFSKQRELYLY